MGTTVPTTLKQLQQLIGKLNWASSFVPGYKKLIRPIESLLSHKNKATWTEAHTEALNQLLNLIFTRL